ncbi:ATP-binding cassette domain-containing protein [uncultured Propionivibrio sp.]|uniref:methionine ABC transporter ATP-binding protein n=1 Tax=uncultured Propionivibrio sp. TaxID=426737 RepID=UPI0029C0CC7B|nr:ATP-binding cassette domain-containing protein [uncultured Propionivibrio sp.]
MIELDDISVAFAAKGQHVQAVKHASLRIRAGEIFGIVGSSGAGKSTLLRTINLLERPDSGRVRLDGQDITDLKGAALRRERQKIGMIFQHFNLMHTCTVRENVAFTLHIAGATRQEIDRRVPELLGLVGLSDKAEAYPSQLSGGQKQRVGIARAIANHPEVLLCDEPTSALDLETSAAILELLREINTRLGITIVLISHEMAVIKKICTRVAVMDQGEVIEQGDVYDIFATPQHAFTQQLVEHTFNLELPERVTRDLQGTLLKILFLGERAEHPVLSEATLRYGLSVNILHGKIEYINHRPIGLLIALLRDRGGGPSRIDEAVDFVRNSTARVEILHA